MRTNCDIKGVTPLSYAGKIGRNADVSAAKCCAVVSSNTVVGIE